MPLSDDELALLRAVCDRPEDDTPRLVYADWLDDQGDPLLELHAKLIRAQCRFASQGRQMTDDDYCSASEEIHALLLASCHWEGSGWAAGNALSMRLIDRDRGGTGYTRVSRWDRGFPADVTFQSVVSYERAAGFGLYDDRLYERVPIRRTCVRGRKPRWRVDHPTGGPADQNRYFWRISRGQVLRPEELNPPVFNQLTGGNSYPTYRIARTAIEYAFTDAGRVQCGLPPRFNLPANETAAASAKGAA